MSPASPEPGAVVAAMFARDLASQKLGMRVEVARAGFARVSLTVAADMVNGHGHCHGGIVFSLADSAFAFACNGDNRVTVAADCTISYLAPVEAGDALLAEAVEQAVRGRSGVYDVAVRNQRGEMVAMMRGRSRRIGGAVITP